MSEAKSPAIELRGISVSFGGKRAVDQLELTVERGEILGFLGPNGAGKTTSIRVMLDLLRPDCGELRLLGSEHRADAKLRRRVGFLPGDLALFPHLSGAETLDFFARLYGANSSQRDDVLDRLGFDRSALARPLSTYSTGMRQMMGITIAFQHAPELLILDEPSTGLDPIVRDAFLGLVRDRAAEGRTILFSSHVLAEVEECADRVALIRDGRLRLVETVASLRARFPRRLRLHYRDGRREERTQKGSVAELLAGIDADALIDLEVRPADLADIFRDELGEAEPRA